MDEKPLELCCYCNVEPKFGVPLRYNIPVDKPQEEFFMIACWNENCQVRPYMEFDTSTTPSQAESLWREKMHREKQFLHQ